VQKGVVAVETLLTLRNWDEFLCPVGNGGFVCAGPLPSSAGVGEQAGHLKDVSICIRTHSWFSVFPPQIPFLAGSSQRSTLKHHKPSPNFLGAVPVSSSWSFPGAISLSVFVELNLLASSSSSLSQNFAQLLLRFQDNHSTSFIAQQGFGRKGKLNEESSSLSRNFDPAVFTAEASSCFLRNGTAGSSLGRSRLHSLERALGSLVLNRG
jgi:hypothetical protein